MAQIITYPTGTATSADFLLGIQTTTTGAQANPTKKFTMSDVVSAGSGATTVTIDISNAEWLALNATPKTLIAAPGAGKAIKILDASVFFDYASSNFTWTTNINLQINSVTFGTIPSSLSALAADTIFNIATPLANTPSDFGGIITTNTALVTAGGGTTAGGGALKVKIRYEILDTANF